MKKTCTVAAHNKAGLWTGYTQKVGPQISPITSAGRRSLRSPEEHTARPLLQALGGLVDRRASCKYVSIWIQFVDVSSPADGYFCKMAFETESQ